MKTIEERMAEAIRKRREEIGLSQEAMATSAGVHRTYASSIERAKVTISIDVAERIAKSLNITLSELCKRAEQVTRPSR
ncbi:MAG: helix-turn-helix domain-containing protein [Pirellula sp.]|nr:helix-turn-helix domain-containing protein [Pirellula sp.]